MPIDELGVVWLREHWEDLREYNFQWVAAGQEGVIASNPSLEALISRVEYSSAEQAVYAWVDFPELASQ